jgi:hypothetical protein
MLSYKNYKLLNESLGQTIPLGVRSTPTIGIIGAHDIESTLEEARKKCKKMDGEEGEPVEDEPKPEPEDEKGDVEDKIDKKLGKKDDEPEESDEEPKDKEEKPSEDEPREPEDKPTLFQKKQKAKQKKMTKEEVDAEFFQSLSRQLGASTISQKFWDGISEE